MRRPTRVVGSGSTPTRDWLKSFGRWMHSRDAHSEGVGIRRFGYRLPLRFGRAEHPLSPPPPRISRHETSKKRGTAIEPVVEDDVGLLHLVGADVGSRSGDARIR